MYDSTADTLEHIAKVQARLQEVMSALTTRAAHHDESKLAEPEKSGYDQLARDIDGRFFEGHEYEAAIARAQPAIQHHYAANSHHPEHWPSGINDMSLLDIFELLCDWKIGSERRKKSLIQVIEGNREQYGISDQLAAILENTVKELGW